MTIYEKLLDEAYNNGLTVKEKPLQSGDGRIYNDRIAIRKSIETTTCKACVLAEELGHYYTSAGDILNQESSNNRKQENVARRWAFEKLLPLENVVFAIQDGHVNTWDMAEYLNVDEKFLIDALKYYGVLDI